MALPDPADIDRPWLVSYPPGVPPSYAYPDVPLTRLLDDAAQDFPERVALSFLGFRLSYRALLDQVDRLATALEGLGVTRGDRVGVVLPDCPQHVVGLFAGLRIGAVVSLHDPTAEPELLQEQFADSGCRVIICPAAAATRVLALRGRLHGLRHVVATGPEDALPFPRNVLFPVTGRRSRVYVPVVEGGGLHRYTSLIHRSSPSAVQAPLSPAGDVAVLLYPRQSLGGVMLTHRNLVVSAFQLRLWLPDVVAGGEHVLCLSPAMHVWWLAGILSAATVTLVPPHDRRAGLRAIDRGNPTIVLGGPEASAALLRGRGRDAERRDWSSVRIWLSMSQVAGGAAAAGHVPPIRSGALDPAVADRLERLTGGKVRDGFGVPEAPVTHVNPVYGRAKPGSMGLPLPDTRCIVVDRRTEAPVASGTSGTLAVCGPQVTPGYWRRPDATAAVLRAGWLLTTVAGSMSPDGYVSVAAPQPPRD